MRYTYERNTCGIFLWQEFCNWYAHMANFRFGTMHCGHWLAIANEVRTLAECEIMHFQNESMLEYC